MKKTYRSALAGIAAVLAAGICCCSADPLLSIYRECSVTIRYRDTEEGEDPVAGAVFCYYKVASFRQDAAGSGVGVRYETLLKDEEGRPVTVSASGSAEDLEKAAVSAYADGTPRGGTSGKMKTDANGIASASGLPSGIYLIREVQPAPSHLLSAPFLISVPLTEAASGKEGASVSWKYDAVAEPKPQPCGDLAVVKIARGSGAELSRVFHFQITLDTEGSFPWKKQDGETGRVKNGGSLSLKAGDSVVISRIPVGTSYRVTEKEADADGYRTSAEGAEGRIRRTKQSRAIFVNTRQAGRVKKDPSPGSGADAERTSAQKAGSSYGNTVTAAEAVRTGEGADVMFLITAMLFSTAVVFGVLYPMMRKAGNRLAASLRNGKGGGK